MLPSPHVCCGARLRLRLWHGPRTRCPSVCPSRPTMLPEAQAAAPHQPGRGAALVSPGQAGTPLITGPALLRSPAGREAPVHLPWLGERTKEGICGRGSAAAGCAAARLIRPVPPGAPAQPMLPCPQHGTPAGPCTGSTGGRGCLRHEGPCGAGRGPGPPAAPRPRLPPWRVHPRSRHTHRCRGGVHPG